jgi:hypothetical protein
MSRYLSAADPQFVQILSIPVLSPVRLSQSRAWWKHRAMQAP